MLYPPESFCCHPRVTPLTEIELAIREREEQKFQEGVEILVHATLKWIQSFSPPKDGPHK